MPEELGRVFVPVQLLEELGLRHSTLVTSMRLALPNIVNECMDVAGNGSAYHWGLERIDNSKVSRECWRRVAGSCLALVCRP